MRTAGLVALLIFSSSHLTGCRDAFREPPGAASQAATEAITIEAKEITNSLGMRLIWIPAGEFQMGAPDSDLDAPAQTRPQHRVHITKPFRLAKFETTFAQFRQFVTETAYQMEAERDGTGSWGYTGSKEALLVQDPKFNWKSAGFDQGDDHPVVNVTWNDAVEFCRWLSQKEKRAYRLPTEAEWEYACRAGSNSNWYAGNDEQILPSIANVADRSLSTNRIAFRYAKPWDDGFAFTAPVGRFQANAFGLHDMHGNVWEWCSDWYDEKFYSQSPEDDPQGPLTPQMFRVQRGGSWINLPRSSFSAHRLWNVPGTRNATSGFRVACDS